MSDQEFAYYYCVDKRSLKYLIFGPLECILISIINIRWCFLYILVMIEMLMFALLYFEGGYVAFWGKLYKTVKGMQHSENSCIKNSGIWLWWRSLFFFLSAHLFIMHSLGLSFHCVYQNENIGLDQIVFSAFFQALKCYQNGYSIH